jgi:hypothetical protein
MPHGDGMYISGGDNKVATYKGNIYINYYIGNEYMYNNF